MTTRLLPTDEWDRLADTELGPHLDALKAKRDHVDLLVVENDDGQIVAHVALLSWVHVEGLAASAPGALLALSRAVSDYCAGHGITGVYSNAMSPETERILTWKRGTPIPGTAYIWYPTRQRPILPEASCHPSS